jgi:FMN-binding domain
LRRALLTVGGTLAGIAALVAFKFQPAGAGTAAAGLSGAGAVPSATGTAVGAPPTVAANASEATKPSATAAPSGGTKGGGTSAGGTSGGGTNGGGTGQSAAARVITGAVANTSYGPMQVQITVAGKIITKAVAVQQTNTGAQSQQIDAMAIPQLNQETLTAQSANINAVSGASYTSAGYKQSLQSAIDQAGL